MFKLTTTRPDLQAGAHVIWNEMRNYGLLEKVFYDGQVKDPYDLYEGFDNVDDLAFAYQDDKLCGAVWIQRTEHRVGRIHCVGFPPLDSTQANKIVEDYLQKKLDRSNKSCYSIIVGITPYRAVARHFRKLGFSDSVKLPDYHYDIYKQRYVDCWQIFLTSKRG